MRLELTGRHVEITPALRRLVDKKLARLDRLLNDSAVSAQAVLTREKRGCRADVTLHARGEKFLHGVGGAASWETSLGQAIAKIAQQASRVKGKWRGRKRQKPKAPAGWPAAAPPATGPRRAAPRLNLPPVFLAAHQRIRAMSLADAAREIEATGAELIVFRDAEKRTIGVLYHARSGDLTLVEAEA
jgi:putative sigma-54 modulation protein